MLLPDGRVEQDEHPVHQIRESTAADACRSIVTTDPAEQRFDVEQERDLHRRHDSVRRHRRIHGILGRQRCTASRRDAVEAVHRVRQRMQQTESVQAVHHRRLLRGHGLHGQEKQKAACRRSTRRGAAGDLYDTRYREGQKDGK